MTARKEELIYISSDTAQGTCLNDLGQNPLHVLPYVHLRKMKYKNYRKLSFLVQTPSIYIQIHGHACAHYTNHTFQFLH